MVIRAFIMLLGNSLPPAHEVFLKEASVTKITLQKFESKIKESRDAWMILFYDSSKE
jgi:hypothetical protein